MRSHVDGRRRATIAVAIGLGFLLLVGAAIATPSFNVIRAPVQARGTLEPTSGKNLIVNSKSGVHVKTQGSVDLVTQELVFGPGGHTGWHSHPGPVLVTVKEGSLHLIYADDTSCQGTVYETGDSFVDRGDERVHIARASPFDGMVLWATYFVPGDAGTTPFRIDEPDPGTGC
jgi:quercetin dioxygenase-like cupin family protein